MLQNLRPFELMHILKMVLSFVLSIAILSVGSAAAFASVHTRCLMPNDTMSHMDMQPQSDEKKGTIAHMDCMKVEKKKPSHSASCASEKDCIMYYTHLAYAGITDGDIQLKPLFTSNLQQFIHPDQFLTSSEPFSVWRPPRML